MCFPATVLWSLCRPFLLFRLLLPPTLQLCCFCCHSLILLNTFFTDFYILHQGEGEGRDRKDFPSHLCKQANNIDFNVSMMQKKHIRRVQGNISQNTVRINSCILLICKFYEKKHINLPLFVSAFSHAYKAYWDIKNWVTTLFTFSIFCSQWNTLERLKLPTR